MREGGKRGGRGAAMRELGCFMQSCRVDRSDGQRPPDLIQDRMVANFNRVELFGVM